MVYPLCDAKGKALAEGSDDSSYGSACSGHHHLSAAVSAGAGLCGDRHPAASSWRYEFEYVYVNGDFEVSKIIRKEKRKDLYRCDRKDMEYVAEGRKSVPGCKVRDFTSGWEKGRVYTMKVGNDLIYMEPNEEFLEEMRLHRKLQ